MGRRRFVAVLAAALVSAAGLTSANPVRKIHRVGFLAYGGPDLSLLVEAFKRRMRELGYVEGQNFTLHWD